MFQTQIVKDLWLIYQIILQIRNLPKISNIKYICSKENFWIIFQLWTFYFIAQNYILEISFHLK